MKSKYFLYMLTPNPLKGAFTPKSPKGDFTAVELFRPAPLKAPFRGLGVKSPLGDLGVYIALIIMVLFSACEKEIKFSGDEVKTKLVLNGLLTPDFTVKINLTESRFFLDDGLLKKIDNATVTLWKDGSKIEILSNTGEGNYVGTTIPETGDNLRITATCEGFDPVDCSTGIVMPTPIISADTVNFKEEKGYYSDIDSSSYYLMTNFDLNITFKDPENIPNYYTINVYMKYYFSNGDSLVSPVDYDSDDLVFQKGNDLNFLGNDNTIKSTLFNDELFDGKEYKLKIKTKYPVGINIGKSPFYPDEEDFELIHSEISVELQSLSYEYYMYLKTLEAKSNMSSFEESFSEPIQIYTNINGGIGILGSYSSSVYSIPLK